MEQAEQPKSMQFAASDALEGMPDEVKDAAIGPMMGVAAIALNMAMKYHDISMIQDGQLYQQYKLEGRNMVPLHLDMVFHTAVQIEAHLVAANKRVAMLFVAATMEELEDKTGEDVAEPAAPDEPPATPSASADQ